MDYERIKNSLQKAQGVGNQWTSYSDLFMSLAIIFLLLYVILGIRSTGIDVVYQQKIIDAKKEVQETQEQLATYASVGNEYLSQEASAEEREVYQKVFQKLSLLAEQEDAYKKRLAELSAEAAAKEQELAQYQSLIKNIINANLLAKSKMQEQQKDLQAKTELVEDLQANLAANEQQLQENTRQIASISAAKADQAQELARVRQAQVEADHKYQQELSALAQEAATYQEQLSQTQQQMAVQTQELADKLAAALAAAAAEKQNAQAVLASTERQKKGFAADLARLRQQHQQALEAERAKIAQLDQEKLSAQKLANEQQSIRENVEKLNQEFGAKIQELNNNLQQAEQQHHQAQQELVAANAKLDKEIAYQKDLQNENAKYREKIKGLDQALAQQQQALAAEKDQQGVMTAQLAAAQAANVAMQDENKKYAQKVAQLDDELKKALQEIEENKDKVGVQAHLKAKLAAEKTYSEKIDQLNKKLKGELAALKGAQSKWLQDKANLEKELRDRRVAVAQRIKANFAKAKIPIEVDETTGEIHLDFSKNYFDYDSTKLTPGMIKVLQQAIPLYAKSLFADPELAKQIKSVEIVGHASPTYQGKFVDPKSTRLQDRKALNYNMDLSYRRSKEIFNYVFDHRKMKFAYQDQMFAKAKVAGRSYLNVKPPRPKGRIPASFKRKDFCKYYDCSDSQKVAITFELAQ